MLPGSGPYAEGPGRASSRQFPPASALHAPIREESWGPQRRGPLVTRWICNSTFTKASEDPTVRKPLAKAAPAALRRRGATRNPSQHRLRIPHQPERLYAPNHHDYPPDWEGKLMFSASCGGIQDAGRKKHQNRPGGPGQHHPASSLRMDYPGPWAFWDMVLILSERRRGPPCFLLPPNVRWLPLQDVARREA